MDSRPIRISIRDGFYLNPLSKWMAELIEDIIKNMGACSVTSVSFSCAQSLKATMDAMVATCTTRTCMSSSMMESTQRSLTHLKELYVTKNI